MPSSGKIGVGQTVFSRVAIFSVFAGNIRVFCRVRPVIKEDGGGQQAENIVSLDQDDSGVLYINSKGRTQMFEVDRVFGEDNSQDQVGL